MRRIKHIEKIFGLAPPLSIVKRDCQKRRNTIKLQPGKQHKQNQRETSGSQEPIPQKVHDHNHSYANRSIIRTAQLRSRGQHHQRQHSLPGVCRIPLKHQNHQQAKKQGEKYILCSPEKRHVMQGQIKGNLRYHRKGQKPQQIFPGIACVKRSFHQKKAEDRKCCPPDSAQNCIQARPEIQVIHLSGQRRAPIIIQHKNLQQAGPNMICQHGKNRNPF